MSASVVVPQITLRRSRASAAEWDDFARQCGASFRCAYWAARAWQFESHWAYRLFRWDVLATTGGIERKIGQCAIGVGRQWSVFGDGLQLLPQDRGHWAAAMTAVVDRMGPAAYVYGSEWSTEPPRQDDLAAVAGVRVTDVRPTAVQVIDLTRWATFAEYTAAVSSNVRRNVKKAEKSHPGLRIELKPRRAKLAYLRQSFALRKTLFRRKGVDRSTAGMLLRSAARFLSLERYSRTAYLLADETVLASYVGIDFGEAYCYLEGASDPAARGAAWYLLMAMIEHAFVDSGGRGRFVMGSDDGTQHGVDAWEGLRRSRRQCGATDVPTSVVRFTYAPAVRGAAPRPRSAEPADATADETAGATV